VNRLRADRSARAISIVAPGGYGKTTLLAQWALRDERPFAWVSLDRRDNDPIVLLRHIAAAIQAVAPADLRTLDALASSSASIWARVLPRVGAMLGAADRCVLVLDDTHLIQESDAAELLAQLAEHVPEGSTLVLSSRTESAFVSKLRASVPLLEIWADDLALTPRESELLLRSAGVRLSDEERATLISRTEGWAAALYLATLSLNKPAVRSARHEEFLESATPRTSYVVDYLRSEYLAGLSPERLLFLRRTSVLEKLCGALCDATLARKRSFEELEALKRANLFVIPLDGNGEWYRYHPIFRDLLRRELLETEPDLVESFGGRAADWFELHDDPESALEHSLAVGDTDRAARIFSRLALPTYCSGRGASVERWLEQFDERDLARYPGVAVRGAQVFALLGRTEKAERWLYEAERCADDEPDLSAQVAVLRAMLCRDGVGTMLSDAGSALAALPETSEWRVLALVVHAAAHCLLGDNDQANEIFGEAVAHARRIGFTETQVVATSQRMLLSEEAHDLASSDKRANELSDLLANGMLDASAPAAIAFAAEARSQLRHGNWDTARALLGQAQQLTPFLTETIPWLAVQTRLELGRTFVALRDVASARVLLAEIDEIFERRPDLGVLGAQTEAFRNSLDRVPVLERGKGSNLTAAEMRLMPYLPTHLSFREIGDELHLSRNTIKTQAISVYRKLGVSTRGDAIDEAVRLGLVTDALPGKGFVPFLADDPRRD
jgi:LuxR family maltose regulon positive regulatory protein